MPSQSRRDHRPEGTARLLAFLTSTLLLSLLFLTPSPPSPPPPPLPITLIPPPPSPPPSPPSPPPSPPSKPRPLKATRSPRTPLLTPSPPPNPSQPPPPPVFGLSPLSLGRTGSFTVPLGNTLGIAPEDSTAPYQPGSPFVSLSEVDTPPEILSRPEPIYPEPLRASGIEGSVVLSVVIDAQGRVEGIRLLSATHPGFVTSAIEYARGIRFRPALKGGQPVAVEVRLPVRFLLR